MPRTIHNIIDVSKNQFFNISTITKAFLCFGKRLPSQQSKIIFYYETKDFVHTAYK